MQARQADLFSGSRQVPVPVYTDGVHLTLDYADWTIGSAFAGGVARFQWKTFDAVHDLAATIGLKRHWFENRRGSYPHYDMTNPYTARRAVEAGALLLSDWKGYARLVAAPGSPLRPAGWQPATMQYADAIAAVEVRNLRLMALFGSGRRRRNRTMAARAPDERDGR